MKKKAQNKITQTKIKMKNKIFSVLMSYGVWHIYLHVSWTTCF